MKSLKERVSAIAEKHNWKIQDLPNDQIKLDISMKLNDGTIRFQYVYLWINTLDGGKSIYMNSRIGPYNNTLIYQILKKTSTLCRYSNLAIAPDTYNGQPMESFIIQAIPNIDTSDELLDSIIFEVGNNADYIEDVFYGGDNV